MAAARTRTRRDHVPVFEYHGWIALRHTAAFWDPPLDVAESVHNEIVRRVSAEIDALRLGSGKAWILTSNGSHFVSIHGLNNHRTPEVVAFFERVGEIAPGSYGVLYTHDGEAGLGEPRSPDEVGENDEDWYRRVMVRGEVRRERVDEFSPMIGALEDPMPD